MLRAISWFFEGRFESIALTLSYIVIYKIRRSSLLKLRIYKAAVFLQKRNRNNNKICHVSLLLKFILGLQKLSFVTKIAWLGEGRSSTTTQFNNSINQMSIFSYNADSMQRWTYKHSRIKQILIYFAADFISSLGSNIIVLFHLPWDNVILNYSLWKQGLVEFMLHISSVTAFIYRDFSLVYRRGRWNHLPQLRFIFRSA